MAGENKVLSLTFPAAGDLSTKQYKFMTLSSGSIDTAGSAVATIGVLQNKPSEADAAGEVMVIGVTNVMLGGTVTELAKLTPDSNGDAVATTSDDAEYSAIALEAGDDNDIVSCLLCIGGSLSGAGDD
jgi:hypothetical protein